MQESQTSLELEGMPEADLSLNRIEAWMQQSVIDRPPVRFGTHHVNSLVHRNVDFSKWATLKDLWCDSEFQVEHHLESIRMDPHLGETFPVFWPNLGPEVYAAFFGAKLNFTRHNAFADPLDCDVAEVSHLLSFDWENPYLKKIEEMTRIALDMCQGKSLVGYTDLHPGLDCVGAWRGSQNLCIDCLENPDEIKKLVELATRHFVPLFDHFDQILKEAGQYSVNWLQIPSRAKLHVPSCDYASLLSHQTFENLGLTPIIQEVNSIDHNIFHLNGRGVAKNLDYILDIPKIRCIQWVQGYGSDQQILKWRKMIERILEKGRSIVVNIQAPELEDFIEAFPNPEGIFLFMEAFTEDEADILKRISRW
jgi:hypothetical protein